MEEKQAEIKALFEELHEVIHGLKIPLGDLERLHRIYTRLRELSREVGR